MDNFNEMGVGHNVTTEQIISLIRQRRSHRTYLDKPVEQEKMETLIDIYRYAPTGGNFQTVKILVITDRAKMKKLAGLAVAQWRQWLIDIDRKVAGF